MGFKALGGLNISDVEGNLSSAMAILVTNCHLSTDESLTGISFLVKIQSGAPHNCLLGSLVACMSAIKLSIRLYKLPLKVCSVALPSL